MISVGIFAKTFPGSDPASVLGAVQRAGYDVAHYNMACSGLPSLPDRIPPGVCQAITDAERETGVRLAAVSATFNMIHADPAERRRGMKGLAAIAAAAHELGIPLLTLCTGTRDAEDQWRGHPDNGTPEAWRDLLAGMGEAIGIAERFDVALGVEPEQANVVDSAERAARLIGELGSPRVKIVIDPANLFERVSADERRRIIAEAVDALAPHIVMAHAKDRDAAGRFIAAGQGVIDFPHYIGCLRAAGFDGPLIAHGLSPEEAPAVGAWLKRTLAECGLA